MGQYYKPVSLNENGSNPVGWVYSHDIKTKYTLDNGKSFTSGSGLKLMEHSWIKNPFVRTVERLLTEGQPWYKTRIVWAGDYADPEYLDGKEGVTLYNMCTDDLKTTIKRLSLPSYYRYIVNHSRKIYVDKTKGRKDKDGWQIHPLPLLTCDGNGRGGGDFHGKDPKKLVGSWAGDIISVEKKIPEGYQELKFLLTE